MACILCGDGIDYRRVTCPDCLAKRVAEKKAKLQQINQDCQPLRDKIRASIEEQKPILKQNMVNGLHQARINALKEFVARTRQRVEEDQKKAERMRNKLQIRRAALDESRAVLRRKQAQLHTHIPAPLVTDMQRLCEQKISELTNLRRSFIAELLSFFPINPSPTSERESLIINIILPNDGIYTSHPPDTLSAALGYVAHIVYLVAAYLGVLLPYPIEFAGARSAVCTTDDPPRRFPLYGTRFSDMEVGTRLINKDIVYLCFTQGVYIKRAKHNRTLPNLMALFRAETLGWPGAREWSRPSSQKPLPLLRVQSVTQIEPPPTNIDNNSSSNTSNKEDIQQPQPQQTNSSNKKVSTGSEDDDFIVLEDTVVPTPSQAEELAHFERAMFIDTS